MDISIFIFFLKLVGYIKCLGDFVVYIVVNFCGDGKIFEL